VIEIQNGEVKPRTYIEKDLRDKMVIFHTLELHVSHSKSKIEIHLRFFQGPPLHTRLDPLSPIE
jgi:hypothetical protein